MASGRNTVRWSAAIALIVAVLLTIAASSALLVAVGFGIESDELRSNPNYSRVYEQQTKTAANIAVSIYLFISLLPTFLLAKAAAFKWPDSRVLRSLCSFATVMVASYLCTLIWLGILTPDFVRTMHDAIRRVILTSLNA